MIRRTVVAMVLGLASTARADVPPSPDSPDAHCTLEEQCKAGVMCPYTFSPGKKPAPGEVPEGQACRADATAKGLESRCRNGGLYGGNELYCPKGATGTWTPPAKATATPTAAPAPSASAPADGGKGKSGCAASAGQPSGSGSALVVAGAALLLASRRRRRG